MGGFGDSGTLSSAELYDPDNFPEQRRPVITSSPQVIRYGNPVTITGENFRGDSEASGGHAQSSAVNYPLIQLRAVEGDQRAWLIADPRTSFWDDPMTLSISNLPPTLNPGLHYLTVVTAGVASEAKLVNLKCSLAIVEDPADTTAEIGSTVTFTVRTQGGRSFQWQKDGRDIPGAVASTYTTPPITAADSGTIYRVMVYGGCKNRRSSTATLTIADDEPPVARVDSPSGGEYWQLSPNEDSPIRERVTWTMSDNVRICRVDVSLLYSDDGGKTYSKAPRGGGLPESFGAGGTCRYPGEATSSVVYNVPTGPPSGRPGSLYKIRLEVEDHARHVKTVESSSPFYIVRPNPDTVKTLILWNSARMRSKLKITKVRTDALATKLDELANHPRVLGFVVDLDEKKSLRQLYRFWDQNPSNAGKANAVLFGCHPPYPADCRKQDREGVHDVLRELLEIYTGVESLVLVGDDRILPLARIRDDTSLLPESRYPEGDDLTRNGTTVGRALAKDLYLSDDPLAVRDPVRGDELDGHLFLPDLAIGRLVETPDEITTTIATFISQDGILDLSLLDPEEGHKVLVTGYDFLLDSGGTIRERWKNVLGLPVPHSDMALAPVDGELVTPAWDEVSVDARRGALRRHLAGNGGERFAIMSLNGHATHYEAGVPGTDPFDINGLGTAEIYGDDACGSRTSGALDLAGSVIYAVGCHGGLSVGGSCATDDDHSLDLPQTFMSRGALAYVANTGYGWGLKHGIGYGERLVEILTEEMSRGGTVAVGEAVRATKTRYFLEAPRLDAYDEKSLMQWTFYGLPMYAVKTGIAQGRSRDWQREAPMKAFDAGLHEVERLEAVEVRRRLEPKASSPPYLIRVSHKFGFTAPGIYTKRNAAGEELPEEPGCPSPDRGEPEGCYYTLNDLAGRGTGSTDSPIQPYFIVDSRFSATSLHGVVWMGGEYEEEDDWVPILAELASNGGDGSDHGAAPRHRIARPRSRRRPTGEDPDTCRSNDLELASLVVPTGEMLKKKPSDLTYSVERLYREIDLETFYFNDRRNAGANCDREGPFLLEGPYDGAHHTLESKTVDWAVPAIDDAGVWRVVVVWNDGSLGVDRRGRWVPLDLDDDGSGTWRGSRRFPDADHITYVIQAVDRRGNVTWLDFVTDELPASGVPLDEPMPVDVTLY